MLWWVLVLTIEYLDKKLIKSFHELILPVMYRYFGFWLAIEDIALLNTVEGFLYHRQRHLSRLTTSEGSMECWVLCKAKPS